MLALYGSHCVPHPCLACPLTLKFPHPLPAAAPPGIAIWKCQTAIALTQASFVIGSVFLKSSLKYVDEDKGEAFSPIVYALAREACAGPILLLLSWIMAGGCRQLCAWLLLAARPEASQEIGRLLCTTVTHFESTTAAAVPAAHPSTLCPRACLPALPQPQGTRTPSARICGGCCSWAALCSFRSCSTSWASNCRGWW